MYNIKRIHVKRDKYSHKLWTDFLIKAGIRSEENVDYTIGIYDNERIIATGSIFQNIIKCTAVDIEYTGGKVFNILITELMSEIFERDYEACYVYTKEDAMNSFMHLGFKEIERVNNELIFLEKSNYGFNDYIEGLRKTKNTANRIAGIVMNANPFTMGHLHLVETASLDNDYVHIFVLSEDLSDFPAEIRYELVQKGTSHLNNIILHKTEDYMISAKTFPSYFLKENSDVTYIQACLDATIFKKHISPALGITRRYVGEEPLSPSTAIYNKAMADVFGKELELIVIPRIESNNEAISASRVRKLFAQGLLNDIKPLVPQTTYDFLVSLDGDKIKDKIKIKY